MLQSGKHSNQDSGGGQVFSPPNWKKNMRRYLIKAEAVAGLIILLVGSGCAAPSTFRGFFQEHRSNLSVAEQGLLLETLQVVSLLEQYRLALERQDMDLLLSGYSSEYFHNEHGLEWWQDRLEKSYFAPFDRLEAELGPVRVEFVRQESGYWLRQEYFDWLHSPQGEKRPFQAYRIILPTAAGPVELFLGETTPVPSPPARDYSPMRSPGIKPGETRAGGPITVTVSSLIDPGVERPLSEVSSRITIRGYLKAGEEAGDFTSILRERTIFLMEKEGGEWKIISQF